MTAADLLERVRAAGLRIRAEGDRLKIAPASALTPEFRAEIVAHKPELLRLLADQKPAPVAPPPLLLPSDLGGYCPEHRRWLSRHEQAAERCGWCEQGLPLVAPTGVPLPRPLSCLSCGVELAPERAYRCRPCVEAAVQVVVALVEASADE